MPVTGGFASAGVAVGRWLRLLLVLAAALLAAVMGTVLAAELNLATGGTAQPFPSVRVGWVRTPSRLGGDPWWWTVGATVGVAVAGLGLWGAQRGYEGQAARLRALVPAGQLPEPWMVQRPTEVGLVVSAVLAGGGPGRRAGGLRDRATVGVTTAVEGAGGFGKTTVAKMVRSDGRILRRF